MLVTTWNVRNNFRTVKTFFPKYSRVVDYTLPVLCSELVETEGFLLAKRRKVFQVKSTIAGSLLSRQMSRKGVT
jgi:hypothetical protein